MTIEQVGMGLALAFTVSAWGCNADQEPGNPAPTDAGGNANTDVAADTAGEATETGGDSTSARLAIFAGADITSVEKTAAVKLVALDLDSRASAGTTTFPSVGYGDAIATASGGRGFLIQRSDSTVVVLDAAEPWKSAKTIDVAGADAGPSGTNPYAVVVAGTKAYVPLYGKNTIAILDVSAGAITGSVDLSRFLDGADLDGTVEVFDGVFDGSTKRAYFVLGRIPLEKGADPDRASHCLPAGPILVGVDATTDQLIDLDGDAGGPELSLLGENPSALVPDLPHRRLFIVETGCYVAPDGGLGSAEMQATYRREGRGVEVVGLDSLTATWLYRHESPNRLSGFVSVDDAHAFVSLDDPPPVFTTRWHSLNPSTGSLGAEVTDFPQYFPKYLGTNQVLGISVVTLDGAMGNALVAFDVAAGHATTLVPDLFHDARFSAAYTGWAPLQ